MHLCRFPPATITVLQRIIERSYPQGLRYEIDAYGCRLIVQLFNVSSDKAIPVTQSRLMIRLLETLYNAGWLLCAPYQVNGFFFQTRAASARAMQVDVSCLQMARCTIPHRHPRGNKAGRGRHGIEVQESAAQPWSLLWSARRLSSAAWVCCLGLWFGRSQPYCWFPDFRHVSLALIWYICRALSLIESWVENFLHDLLWLLAQQGWRVYASLGKFLEPGA